MLHNVTVRQRKAIYLLARGVPVVSVAEQLKLQRQTLYRWKQKPEFQQEFDRVMEEMREGFRHRMVNLIDVSLNAVENGLAAWGNDPKRVQAGLDVLRMLNLHRVMFPDAPKTVPDRPELP